MRICRTVSDLRATLDGERARGRRIGFVPTMGALHEGHLSLLRRARLDADVVVISIFVNPLQFNEQSDLAAYPRDLEADARMSERAGADVLFAPDVSEMYPQGFDTSVVVRGVTAPLEGAMRGDAHFIGVATVVAKLFNMVQPGIAYFGQKDAQQAAVIRRMARDLDFPVRVEVCATVRESDGLAMSSRNVRLDAASRTQALALVRSLEAARDAISAGEHDGDAVVQLATSRMRTLGVEPEYLDVVSPDTFEHVATIDGPVVIAVAARVGGVRLIDNMLASPPGA